VHAVEEADTQGSASQATTVATTATVEIDASSFLGVPSLPIYMTGAQKPTVIQLAGKNGRDVLAALAALQPGIDRPIVTMNASVKPAAELYKLLDDLTTHTPSYRMTAAEQYVGGALITIAFFAKCADKKCDVSESDNVVIGGYGLQLSADRASYFDANVSLLFTYSMVNKICVRLFGFNPEYEAERFQKCVFSAPKPKCDVVPAAQYISIARMGGNTVIPLNGEKTWEELCAVLKDTERYVVGNSFVLKPVAELLAAGSAETLPKLVTPGEHSNASAFWTLLACRLEGPFRKQGKKCLDENPNVQVFDNRFIGYTPQNDQDAVVPFDAFDAFVARVKDHFEYNGYVKKATLPGSDADA